MFFDRYQAGEQLASRLEHYRGSHTVIYAIPRGGVLVALPIAQALHAPMDIVITRKIGHPYNPEFAVSAITEHGDLVRNDMGDCGLDESWLEAQRFTQQTEAHRRRNAYKGNAASLCATDKVAILVDDGIATGLSIKAAITTIKKQRPSKLVLAVPVGPHETITELAQLVDEVVVLKDESRFHGAVGAYYTSFPEVSDADVVEALRQAADPGNNSPATSLPKDTRLHAINKQNNN